jgi:branched-chain amino acid aminotransferase
VTRGSGGAGLGTAAQGRPDWWPPSGRCRHDWPERARAGWSVMTAATRHPPPEVLPPALKGQGRGSPLLARLEAEAAGCDDALLLSLDGRHHRGHHVERLLAVGDTLRTPAPAEGLLAGVTRELVLDLARGGVQVEEGSPGPGPSWTGPRKCSPP